VGDSRTAVFHYLSCHLVISLEEQGQRYILFPEEPNVLSRNYQENRQRNRFVSGMSLSCPTVIIEHWTLIMAEVNDIRLTSQRHWWVSTNRRILLTLYFIVSSSFSLFIQN
jgi:hypothetical protein